ncbi:MAG: selenocysteine-specific translation elongation factor [Gemmatimonadetes bacterium]|nr:selenocysteine-specific translation elongation factor [Gemmatimonadota bacterium]
MRHLILGTAGHIDHGKTALVKALTGTDTDRLPEEKKRGITIDLGFAELDLGTAGRLGIVDVPGHESFIRNMLAGATGIDLVLLVVAADEGVMPQTREHLAIVQLLGVERAVVAITKIDLVDSEWLALVRDEIRDALDSTPYRASPLVPTSVVTGQGITELRDTLVEESSIAQPRAETDLVRLPIDRVFTVRGTGTVITGTLWTGTLREGERVWIMPERLAARVRGLQVHGRPVQHACAGERTAAALTGTNVDARSLRRGQTLVTSEAWAASPILTVWLSVLSDSAWSIEPRQRLHVHLGASQVLGRVTLLDAGRVQPGQAAWAQLRLEEPIVARVRDRLVLRSYSPVTTIGGAVVVENEPRKRRRLDPRDRQSLEALRGGGAEESVAAALRLAAWQGVPEESLPLRTGLRPAEIEAILATQSTTRVAGRLLPPQVSEEARRLLEERVGRFHTDHPLRPGMPLDEVRRLLGPNTPPGLPDVLLAQLVAAGALEIRGSLVARREFRPSLRPDQKHTKNRIESVYQEAGLAPPTVEELPDELRTNPDLWPLLKLLEDEGRIVPLAEHLFASSDAVRQAASDLIRHLQGRSDLGPADFKSTLPVSRKHLIPLLEYFDRMELTVRTGAGRAVATALPNAFPFVAKEQKSAAE